MSRGLKRCPGCSTEKSRAEFNKNSKRYDGLKSYCRNCENVKRRENPNWGAAGKKERIEAFYCLTNSVKDVPCMDCGNKYPPCVMDFDHRNPKEKKFNIATGTHRSLRLVQEEIDKCDVVCANCHRIRTYGR